MLLEYEQIRYERRRHKGVSIRMKINTYNQKKLIGRQKFNACIKAFEFGKNDQTGFDMKQIRDDLWEKI